MALFQGNPAYWNIIIWPELLSISIKSSSMTMNSHHVSSRWWFQILFIFTATWGYDPIWLIFFKGVETTNWMNSHHVSSISAPFFVVCAKKSSPRFYGTTSLIIKYHQLIQICAVRKTLSNEKKTKSSCLGYIYRGWNPTLLCGDYHKPLQDPY